MRAVWFWELLQRAFDLRATSPYFTRLSALEIVAQDRNSSLIDSSARHYLIQRIKDNPIENWIVLNGR